MKLGALVLPYLVLTAAGCHGCHEDHPYVPYAIGSATLPALSVLVDAGTAAILSEASDASASFAEEPAIAAPPGISSWGLQGVTLAAPPGLVFALATVRDFDGDGVMDAFAVVRPAEGNDPGEVAFYRGAAGGTDPLSPSATFVPPGELSRDGSCVPVDRLVLVGKRSVLAELGAQCPQHPSSAPVRWIAIVAGSPTPKVRLAVTVADPPGAPALSVHAEAADHDADGVEDLDLRVTLEGGGAPLEPGPRVTATLAWLDRQAGLSRDAAATESSFGALAASARAHAVRAKDAGSVPGFVAQTRALWRAMCANGGAPRLVGIAGTGAITCGASRALEDAGLAEVRAYVTMADPLRAALALDRAQRAPASRTVARASEAQGWIVPLAPLATALAVRAVAAVPIVGKGHEPSWGPLTFESNGKLLVRTRAGVVRVDPDQGDEAAATDMPDWKTAVTSPDGAMRWIEAYDPCDGLPVRATFAPASGDDVRDLALPVQASLGDRCVGSRGAPAQVLPVLWGAAGLEAIVDGVPVLIAADLSRALPLATFVDGPHTPGSPRSPSGKALVLPTSLGLLVRGETHARLLRAPELDGTYAEQRDCVVTDDTTHVACVRSGKAWVGAWSGP